MRLSVDVGFRVFTLGLTTASLAACGTLSGGETPLQSLDANAGVERAGPAGDYPMVLGDPYTLDGVLYTPSDVLNYDVVGFAGIDQGTGVTIAHRTLPLPSYVEVTSLVTGKTILARVERRGPMSGKEFVAFSPAAAAQLGEGAGAAIRLRRVNPPEKDRAELRAGRAANDRIETPKSLVEVLRRKLPASGEASLRASTLPRLAEAPPLAETKPVPASRTDNASETSLPSAVQENGASAAPAQKSARGSTAEPGVGASFVIQAAAFANPDNAAKAAEALGGYVTTAGKFYRVQTGPFTSRGQADAALAKVRAAGYSDARVQTAG